MVIHAGYPLFGGRVEVGELPPPSLLGISGETAEAGAVSLSMMSRAILEKALILTQNAVVGHPAPTM